MSGDGLVVDHAKSFAGIAGSVVSAASYVECDTGCQCLESSLYGSAGNAQFALDEQGRLLKTDASHFLTAEPAGNKAIHVSAVVRGVHGRQFNRSGTEKIGLFGNPFA